MNALSSFNRNYLLQKLSSEEFDLLIIGGGITGGGIALDAASRGIKTVLVEKQDFAAGTSSRSTKLIHGGLRYMEHKELGLVKELGQERSILYHNAPHLILPEKILLPVLKNGTHGYLATSLGFFLYDLIAGVEKNERSKMLSKKETSEEEPLLRRDILKGGVLYTEYRTDDARLTLEIIKTAVKQGALAINYTKAENFIYQNGILTGIQCTDLLSHELFTVKSKQIVNAAGPWVDELRKQDDSLMGKRLHLTKGVHLVIAREKFPLSKSVYFSSTDNRMIFAIPREKITYIGTTDTNYSGDLENPVVTREDTRYLLHAVNEMFPAVKLAMSDIISSWAGLRPLIHEDGKSPSELSRKDEIFISKSGMISIAGGKLTGYRKMAERVMNRVNKKLQCKTKHLKISGGDFENPEQVNDYIYEIFEKIKLTGLDNDTAARLVRTYGKQSEIIIEKFLTVNDTDSDIRLAKAELWFAVNNEAIHKLQDFFIRRTGMLLFQPWLIKKLQPVILEEMKNYFHWSEERFHSEKNEMDAISRQSVTFEGIEV